MNLRVAKRLHDSLVAGQYIEQIVAGRSFDEYQMDAYFRSAVERQFEILSEALKVAASESEELYEKIPELVPRLKTLLGDYEDPSLLE